MVDNDNVLWVGKQVKQLGNKFYNPRTPLVAHLPLPLAHAQSLLELSETANKLRIRLQDNASLFVIHQPLESIQNVPALLETELSNNA